MRSTGSSSVALKYVLPSSQDWGPQLTSGIAPGERRSCTAKHHVLRICERSSRDPRIDVLNMHPDTVLIHRCGEISYADIQVDDWYGII